MSHSRQAAVAPNRNAPLFAALGNETRLWLVDRLARSKPQSIAQLTEGSHLTRQAIAKHLAVLEGAGVVRGVRAGREIHYAIDPAPLEQARGYLDLVSEQWDDALGRLKALVER